ncbi:hypothetical protein VP01_2406g2 [Puccinia sorghi]|uniref:Uncharacterized protein n=1 Tax=Puccinia sorghi TaxID=27349 RepID=A0A0L6V8I7_9BASI|nr:hypothetical protein VP01_2406g2 [Puccinia sorghi]
MDPAIVSRAQLNFDLPSRVRYMKSFLDFTEEDCQIMDEVRPIAKPLVPEIVASACSFFSYILLLTPNCSPTMLVAWRFSPAKMALKARTVTRTISWTVMTILASILLQLKSGKLLSFIAPIKSPVFLNLSADSVFSDIRSRNILERWAMKVSFISFLSRQAIEPIMSVEIFVSLIFKKQIFEFFDQVGIQHTGGARVFSAGNHKPVYIDFCFSPSTADIHLAMTLGYITSKMTAAILTLPSSTWPPEKKNRAVLAFHKISTIHNDLIARHHVLTRYFCFCFSTKQKKISELHSPSTSKVQTPGQEIDPQNRKEYYSQVFMVRSPSTQSSSLLSPPRDAPFQSLVSIAPQRSCSSRPRVPQPADSPHISSIHRPIPLASELHCHQRSISSFGDTSSYFPGKYEENQALTRRPSKGAISIRKFGTRSKKPSSP